MDAEEIKSRTHRLGLEIHQLRTDLGLPPLDQEGSDRVAAVVFAGVVPCQHEIRPVDRLQRYAQCVRCWDPGTRRPVRASDFDIKFDATGMPETVPPRRMADHVRDGLGEISKPYEAPKLTPASIGTVGGRELDVLAEALYGLRRLPAGPGSIVETDHSLRARCRALHQRLGIGGDGPSYPERKPRQRWRAQDPRSGCDFEGTLVARDEEMQRWTLENITSRDTGPGAGLIERFMYDFFWTNNRHQMTLLEDAPPQMVVGVDPALPGSDRMMVNVMIDGEVVGQVSADAAMLYKGDAYRALTQLVDAAVGVVRYQLGRRPPEFSATIKINQTFADTDPDRPLAAVMKALREIGVVNESGEEIEAPPMPKIDPVPAPRSLCGSLWSIKPDGDAPPYQAKIVCITWKGPDIESVTFQEDRGSSLTFTCAQFAEGCRTGKIAAFDLADANRARELLQPKLCEACGEIPPKGHAEHVCPATAPHTKTAYMGADAIRLWLQAREAETGKRVDRCCTIGFIVKAQGGTRCPVHEKPPAAPAWVPEWDPFDFRTA